MEIPMGRRTSPNITMEHLRMNNPFKNMLSGWGQPAKGGGITAQAQNQLANRAAGMWMPPATWNENVPEDELSFVGVLSRWSGYGVMGALQSTYPLIDK